uniref:Dynein light chain n=1 Tax=Cyanoptyche gloeocystis TaxID=77922 RepID=A0A7S2JPB2_9EUKA|mmetsp:Transcript_2701/g.4880  ORF Transcript_2701/g.4880 Transcript_2701/m.4880 type:complete len:109 (+) Transcript_2701:48-374(+)
MSQAAPGGPAKKDKKDVVDPKKIPRMKSTDMNAEMNEFCKQVVQEGIQGKTIDKDIAVHIKKAMEQKYQGSWHCIVGQHFSASVTHETKHMALFNIGKLNFLVFKSKE